MNEAPSDQLRSVAGSKWKRIEADTVPDDTHIVRYMKLSTFFMLLSRRVFLPNLRKLQQIDEHEGGMPSYLFGRYYGHHLRNILEPHENWLLERAKAPKVPKQTTGDGYYAYFRFLADVWLTELYSKAPLHLVLEPIRTRFSRFMAALWPERSAPS
jgi:hypothetical protein